MECITDSANLRNYSSRQFVVLTGDDETGWDTETAKPSLIFSQLNLAFRADSGERFRGRVRASQAYFVREKRLLGGKVSRERTRKTTIERDFCFLSRYLSSGVKGTIL
jgi:hypothetical protein